MSETDDTDDLLLIPPDFFVQDFEIDFQQPYLRVFDSIITQVNKLEDRLDHMESSTSDLIIFNGVMNETQNRKDRHTGMESTQSTPQKPKTKFKLNSLPSSPSTDRYSPTKIRTNLFAPKNLVNYYEDTTDRNNLAGVDSQTSSSKMKGSVLSEIDEFISNVRTIERINKGKEYDVTKKRLDAEDVNKLINKLEESESKEIETEVKHIEGNTSNLEGGMKYVMYKDRDLKENSKGKRITNSTSPTLKKAQPSQKTVTTTDSYITEEIQSVTSSEDTQATAIHYVKSAPDITHIPDERFTHENKIMLTYKRDIRQNLPSNSCAGDAAKSSVPSRDSLKILSLKDLWSDKDGENNTSERTRLFQKLEEEKLRRQHCEHIIQSLQTRILELQERLAVALDVDEAKDEAIVKFHEAWESAGNRLKNANKENEELKAEIEGLKSRNQKELQEAYMKIAHYEEEVSKALNIAHNAQHKLMTLEKQCNNFDNERKDFEMQLRTVQGKLDDEMEKSKHLSEAITQKEMELNENKNVLSSARKEVMQSKKAVEICQQEFASLKAECASLQMQISEKQKINVDLESLKKKLLTEIETHKKNEKSLQEELQKYKDSMEQHKTDLRNFYQNQVETVVREKLREFQTQLDRAENLLQEEVKSKELSIARTAAMHIQSISEKHALEIQLLEEKHKEEVRLYQVQLSQNEQQIHSLKVKFQQQQDRKAQLIQQLHKVMEAQWLEALKIINNSKSPVSLNSDQISSLKSKSYLDFEELLNSNEVKNPEGGRHNEVGMESVESTSSLVEDERKLKENGQYRSQKNRKQSEQELQKYVQMLLSKSAEDIKQHALEKECTDNTSEQRTHQDEAKSSRASSKERKWGKPPWK